MLQPKEQDKNLQEQLNEEKIGNLPEKEFRVMIVKMIQSHKKNGGTDREDTRNVQQRPSRTKEQTEMNRTINEKKIH